MISTAILAELQIVIDAASSDPHRILGLHEVFKGGRECLSIRVFIPQAKTITLIDDNDETYSVELIKIHDDGFFEQLIKDRKRWFRYKLKIEDYFGNKWTTYDPYSFAPVLSDLDFYLFREGTHYKIFEKLGAHLTEIDGVKGTVFAVWAPNARRVSVIGDFNNWDGRRNQMRMLYESGIWEIFIPGVCAMDKYKFEIRTNYGRIFEKSDPYGSFFEVRPSKSTLVYDIDRYKWKDEKWLLSRESGEILQRPINIYEVHLGSWKKSDDESRGEGQFLTYLELADELIPYVVSMGYTHIELLPIAEHPFDGSWGYQVTGYFAPTSRYGKPEDFMYFVDKCHENGIGVILDWVPAHFPKDADGLAFFDGSALYEYEDPRKGEHPEWGTLIFNYGRKEVKNFLIANALFWIEKYHIDGLRVDAVASMLYQDYGKSSGEWVPNQYGGNHNLEAVEFFKHLNSVVLDRHPNVMMIAEESTAWAGVSKPLDKGGLGFNFKWNMGFMNDFLSYVSKEPIHRKYHHNNMTFGMFYAYSENFILVLSHDEVVHGKKSLINKMPCDLGQKFANLKVAMAFMMGHPGKKLLFMGGEFGQFSEWSEKKSLDWFLLEYEHHNEFHEFVRDLNFLYKKERAFWFDDFLGTGFEWIDPDDSQRSIFSFIRKGEEKDDILIIICNFTPVSYPKHRVGISYNAELFKKGFKEIFNSDMVKYGGSGLVNSGVIKCENILCNGRDISLPVSVPPLGAVILKPII